MSYGVPRRRFDLLFRLAALHGDEMPMDDIPSRNAKDGLVGVEEAASAVGRCWRCEGELCAC